jgi:hypothetical protein
MAIQRAKKTGDKAGFVSRSDQPAKAAYLGTDFWF